MMVFMVISEWNPGARGYRGSPTDIGSLKNPPKLPQGHPQACCRWPGCYPATEVRLSPKRGILSGGFSSFRAEQAEFVGTGDGFRSVGGSEFLENRLDVAFHGLRADAERLAEFFP
jgi:hypothetical protein